MIDLDDQSGVVNKNRQKSISFLRKLIRASEKGEEAVQTVVADRFRKLGCEVEILRLIPTSLSLEKEFASNEVIEITERISVIGKISGSGGGRSLMFFAHPDSEIVSKTDDWTHDPFSAVMEEGKIFGWGVADDLAGVAIMTEALDKVYKSGTQLRGDLYLCSTASKRNARGVLALLSRGYHVDAAIYLHPAESGEGLREIKAFASGILKFRISVAGRLPDTTEPGHTSFAHLGENPIDKTILIIQALKKMNSKRGARIHNNALDTAVGRSTNLLISYIGGGDREGLTRMAESCVIGASLTFPPEEDLKNVQKEVESFISEAVEKDGWLREHPPKIDWLFGSQGVEVPVEHPLYQTVSRAIQETIGDAPHVNPLHSASDIRNPILFSGIPTVGLGPLAGDLAQTGGHDEWVEVDDYIKAIKVCAKTIISWCG